MIGWQWHIDISKTYASCCRQITMQACHHNSILQAICSYWWPT